MTRATLVAAGLVRHERDGLVWFAGGSGSPVVLLHGANDQAGTWAVVARSLAEKHRVIVPDLAGHGESEPRDGAIPIPLIVEKLHDILSREDGEGSLSTPSAATNETLRSAQGDGKLTLVGNSMGAWIAILYALAHPQRVARLVLESGGGLNVALAVPLVATNRDEAQVILRAVHGPNAVLPDWAVDALLARAKSSPMLRLTEIVPNLVDARLAEVSVPTTIVWGRDDGVIPFAYVEMLRERIAGAKLHVIDGAAHIPHAQQPERFLACLPAIS